MPTVLRIDGLRVIPIHERPSPSARAHTRQWEEALFYLNCPDGPPELRDNLRFNPTQLTRIQAKLAPHVAALCAAWKEMHGNHE